MSSHPDGTGSSWTENIDVDQPHGLDYRALNDLRIGVRKRLAFQHTQPADNTAGGLHKPGKTSVLLVDTSVNLAAYLIDPSCAEFGMACATAVGKLFYVNDATDEWCILPIFGSICKGGDYTWTGAHEFDASVDFSQVVNFDGSASFGNPVEFSAVDISSFLNCSSSAYFANDVSCKADLVVDGTLVVTSNFDVSGDTDMSGGLNVSGDISMEDISGTVKQRFATAWCSFCGNNGATLLNSYNVASVKRDNDGDYSVTFTAAMADANYATIVTVQDVSVAGVTDGISGGCVSSKTTGCRIKTGAALAYDVSRVNVLIFGT